MLSQARPSTRTMITRWRIYAAPILSQGEPRRFEVLRCYSSGLIALDRGDLLVLPCRFFRFLFSFLVPGLGMFSEAYVIFSVGNLSRESILPCRAEVVDM